ncbi:MAG: glycerol-3-phosphate dehydrogenase subunit GlpB [Deltaproteobacteria bacterium]|jgi:glycerol-3-phosphate dehydrogenase subunit B|nr:glycerol-3-phosphate dehydrogenase subunit GlpB [Deltaproteobacteria bacterium]
MTDLKSIECDLCVIGSGLAGMAVALFAADRGLRVAQTGHTGEIIFASGLLDLLAVCPIGERRLWRNPWAALDALIHDYPEHPYTLINKDHIKAAFNDILNFLKTIGLPYHRGTGYNSGVPTALGTIKQTYAVPHTMWNGVSACKEKSAGLIVDIRGLKGFSARQIAASLRAEWPGLRSARISFPGMDHLNEVYAERMANALLLPYNREKLAAVVRPLVKKSTVVGLPAILGLHQTVEIKSHLEKLIGVPIFEIPTIPPSVPGLRLKEAFERGLRSRGVQYFSLTKALKVRPSAAGRFETHVGRDAVEHSVDSRGVILASGRFIGGGLHADRKRIRESIFDLPVDQPAGRATWHRRDFLNPRGHPINRAGLNIDRFFRPVGDSGEPAFETLFAAGSILAHNDWKRLKCGAGLAIASAYAAVDSYLKIA